MNVTGMLDSLKFENVVIVSHADTTSFASKQKVGAESSTPDKFASTVECRDTHICVHRPATAALPGISTTVFLIPTEGEFSALANLHPTRVLMGPTFDVDTRKDAPMVDMRDWTLGAAREACKVSAFGMQNTFDLLIIKWKRKLVHKDHMLKGCLLYIFCIRVAIYHIAAESNTLELSEFSEAHHRHIHQSGKAVDVNRIDEFFSSAQFAAKKIGANLFTSDRLRSFLKMATRIGLATLVDLYSDPTTFCGIHILEKDNRRSNLLDGIDMTLRYIGGNGDDALSIMKIAMLHGADGIRRGLCIEKLRQVSPAPESETASCDLCSQLDLNSIVCGKSTQWQGVGCCIECYASRAGSYDDVDRIAILNALSCEKLVLRNIEMVKEAADVAKKHDTEVQKQGELHKAELATIRAELVDARKKLRGEKRKSKKSDACPALATPLEGAQSAEEITRMSVEHDVALKEKDASHASEMAAICAEKDLAYARLGEEINDLKEEHARDLTRVERTNPTHTEPAIRTCVEEIQRMEDEIRSMRSFDDTRTEMIDIQRSVLLSNDVEQRILSEEVDALERTGSTIMHLNSIWREKYAYASGEAKATQKMFDTLCNKLGDARLSLA